LAALELELELELLLELLELLEPVDGLAAGDDVSFFAGVLLSDLAGAEDSDFSLGLRSRLGFDRFESDFESLL